MEASSVEATQSIFDATRFENCRSSRSEDPGSMLSLSSSSQTSRYRIGRREDKPVIPLRALIAAF